MAPQLSVLKHESPQPESHDCEQRFTSWQLDVHASPHTVPHWFML